MPAEKKTQSMAAIGVRPAAKPAANSHARPLAAIVYDNGQILLELLQSRAEGEEKRRFVAGLRHLDSYQPAAEE